MWNATMERKQVHYLRKSFLSHPLRMWELHIFRILKSTADLILWNGVDTWSLLCIIYYMCI